MSENVVIIIETRRGARNKKFVSHDLAPADVGWCYNTDRLGYKMGKMSDGRTVTRHSFLQLPLLS